MNLPSTATSHTGHILGNGLIFLTTLFFAGWIIGHGLPFPKVSAVEERYRYYAENSERFDTLFIGSSRVRHQIVPQDFDEETAAAGLPTDSLNVGYSGMWPPESFYYLRQFLALKSPRLKWVFIELMDYRFSHVDEEAPTSRTVYWHDVRHTAMACRWVLESSRMPTEKARLFARHVRLFLQQSVNLGRGSEWAQARLFSKARKRPPKWTILRGFEPEDETVWSDAARLDYLNQVESFRKSPPAVPVRAGFASALRELVADVRRAGAEPVFFFAPTVRPEENLTTGLPEGITVLAFNDPAQYPQLYEADLHYDAGHLNEKGAREFTRLLARRFAEHALQR